MIPTELPGRGDAWFLTLSNTVEADRIVWRAAGRLGAAGADLLQRTLFSSEFAGRRLVLDLSGVDYVSGAGIRAVEAISKAIDDSGGSLELTNLATPVRMSLELAGLLAYTQEGAPGHP